ncbi:7304_t:CDS:2 [Paraglomus brasilianum]|uniref:Glucosamine 6-phosphate N-acetyltransferase n=1 Tax=Paraglomus brasilianum TaxID=144538 RepID=A0A9N9FBT5_9GLOM|nr:7304_t:CDS:2 [Paraglomus brasilianum]
MTGQLLFSTSLISPEVQADLPPGYKIRPLASDDYERGFLDTLTVLTEIGDISKAQFLERFNYLKQHNHEYFTIVILSPDDRVVGAGTVFVERKFIRNTGLVGHIEDIAVNKNQQGKKLGLRCGKSINGLLTIVLSSYIQSPGAAANLILINVFIVLHLTYLVLTVILDCSEKNVPFYEKCGFTRKEVEMAWYCNEAPKAKL